MNSPIAQKSVVEAARKIAQAALDEAGLQDTNRAQTRHRTLGGTLKLKAEQPSTKDPKAWLARWRAEIG
jgi:hypothetical protein